MVAPACPRWLDRVAQTEWRRVAPELERLELLSGLDMTALAAYCDSFAAWRKATAVLRAKGTSFTTKTGYVGQRPEVSIAERAMQRMRQFCVEFGMTPSSRGRMRLPSKKPAEEEQEMDDFIDAGREQRRSKVVPIRARGTKTSK